MTDTDKMKIYISAAKLARRIAFTCRELNLYIRDCRSVASVQQKHFVLLIFLPLQIIVRYIL